MCYYNILCFISLFSFCQTDDEPRILALIAETEQDFKEASLDYIAKVSLFLPLSLCFSQAYTVRCVDVGQFNLDIIILLLLNYICMYRLCQVGTKIPVDIWYCNHILLLSHLSYTPHLHSINMDICQHGYMYCYIQLGSFVGAELVCFLVICRQVKATYITHEHNHFRVYPHTHTYCVPQGILVRCCFYSFLSVMLCNVDYTAWYGHVYIYIYILSLWIPSFSTPSAGT